MKEKLIIASNNAHKVTEIRAILGNRFGELLSLKEAGISHETLEDGESFLQNAEKKAREIAEISGCAALADDSGLCVDALGGAPGIFSARFSGVHGDDQANNEKLLRELSGCKNRSAHYCCAMAVAWPDGRILEREGFLYGEIAESPAGNGGFGYDPLFLLPEKGKTLACLSAEEKNAISHRGRALEAIRAALDDLQNSPSIVLGGFMGVGKTTVGRILAEKLNYSFIDMDDFVAGLAGKTIRELLMEGKEAEVRSWEQKAAALLAVRSRTVIATGGGVLASEKNGALFHKTCKIIHLTRDFNTLYSEISQDPVRRLAYHKSKEELSALLQSRMAAYERHADLTIANDGEAENTAEIILHALACKQEERDGISQ